MRTILPLCKSESLFKLNSCPYSFVIQRAVSTELTYVVGSKLAAQEVQKFPSAHLHKQRQDSLTLQPCIPIKRHPSPVSDALKSKPTYGGCGNYVKFSIRTRVEGRWTEAKQSKADRGSDKV